MSDNHNCDCGHNHDHCCEEDFPKMSLVLDNDEEVICDVIGVFSLTEEAGQEYIALLPEDSEDILLYRFSEDENGEVTLDNIEDDDEYEQVGEVFDQLFLEDEEE